MSSEILVALIAASPPTLAAILGFLANRRSLRRSIGGNPGVSLREVLVRMESRFESRFDRLETKFDRLGDEHVEVRERLARLESHGPSRPETRA